MHTPRLAALLALLAGCAPNANAPDGGDANTALEASATDDAALDAAACPRLTDPVDTPDAAPGNDTYAAFAAGFFTQYCVRCHSSTLLTTAMRNGAPLGLDWDVEALVRMNLPSIRYDVGVSHYMPINPPLPVCDDRRRLVRWIDIGAP